MRNRTSGNPGLVARDSGAMPRNDRRISLPVLDKNLVAGAAEARTVLLQA